MALEMRQKSIKKIVGYIVPVLATGIGSFFGLESTTGLETALAGIISGVITILGIFGVIDSNDETDKEKTKREQKEAIQNAKG